MGLVSREEQLIGAAGTDGQVGHRQVNGPEDEVLDWDAVDWRRVEDNVRRLRQRIFTGLA